jgi:hypothetical protein
MHRGMETREANQQRLGTPRPMNWHCRALWLDASFLLGTPGGHGSLTTLTSCSLPSPSVPESEVEEMSRPRIDCSDRAGVLFPTAVASSL